MNRHSTNVAVSAQVPRVKRDNCPLPVEAKQRANGETQFELVQRRGREADERRIAFNAMIDERRAAGVLDALSSLDCPLSVGTFDGDGNPKGAGWSA